jgi:hypothetical protein
MNPASTKPTTVTRPYVFAQSIHAYSAVSDIYQLLEKNKVKSADMVSPADRTMVLLAEVELLTAINEFSIDVD